MHFNFDIFIHNKGVCTCSFASFWCDHCNCRFAKRKLDDTVFLGNKLRVSYAPQFEDLSDTKEKLEVRRREVIARIKRIVYIFKTSLFFNQQHFVFFLNNFTIETAILMLSLNCRWGSQSHNISLAWSKFFPSGNTATWSCFSQGDKCCREVLLEIMRSCRTGLHLSE